MAYSFRHTNPRLAGVIIKEKVSCGKPNCRCMRENKLHGWYYYLYWREGKKLKKGYLHRSEVKRMRREISKRKAKDSENKIILRELIKSFKDLF
jgi:hypothetical protein